MHRFHVSPDLNAGFLTLASRPKSTDIFFTLDERLKSSFGSPAAYNFKNPFTKLNLSLPRRTPPHMQYETSAQPRRQVSSSILTFLVSQHPSRGQTAAQDVMQSHFRAFFFQQPLTDPAFIRCQIYWVHEFLTSQLGHPSRSHSHAYGWKTQQ